MKPKMVILNKREYYEKFDQAMAYSLEGKHQKCLNLLLELKEKRWIKFELFYKIAEEYELLGKSYEASVILGQTKPESEDNKKQLEKFKNRGLFKGMQYQILENFEIFEEKAECYLFDY